MNENVYSAPQAELGKDESLDIPIEIKKKIRNAWIAGIISITITVIFTLISMYGTDIMGLDAYAFIDVFFMVIFTYGIFKNSRVCAVLMLLLFAANKIIMWMTAGTVSGLPLSLIFLWFYTMGVVGTFQYHQFVKKHQKEEEI